jgi:hypothetical protein
MAQRIPSRPPRRGRGMSVRSIRGKPGKFYDAKSKKIYDISQSYEGDKYDSVLLPATTAALTAGSPYNFFQNLVGKPLLDTNFRTQNRLDPNERMVLERLGLYIHTYQGTVVAFADDIRSVLESSYVHFEINRDLIWDGCATWLPSGYGLYGATTETDETFASIGVPGTAAAARLRRKQMITTEHSLTMALEVQGRLGWIAGYVIPNPTHAMVLKAILHGPISRPATH